MCSFNASVCFTVESGRTLCPRAVCWCTTACKSAYFFLCVSNTYFARGTNGSTARRSTRLCARVGAVSWLPWPPWGTVAAGCWSISVASVVSVGRTLFGKTHTGRHATPSPRSSHEGEHVWWHFCLCECLEVCSAKNKSMRAKKKTSQQPKSSAQCRHRRRHHRQRPTRLVDDEAEDDLEDDQAELLCCVVLCSVV